MDDFEIILFSQIFRYCDIGLSLALPKYVPFPVTVRAVALLSSGFGALKDVAHRLRELSLKTEEQIPLLVLNTQNTTS